MSMSTRPASAKATTSGGLIRKLALMFCWMRASKLRLPERTLAATRSLPVTTSSMGIERPRVADAGRAAVADELKAEPIEVGLETRARQVLRHDPGARRERCLHLRRDEEPALDRFLGEQAGPEHDARVRRVRAGSDRGDQDVAVAERDASGRQVLLGDFLDAVRRGAVVDHLRLGPGVGVFGRGHSGNHGMFVGLLVAPRSSALPAPCPRTRSRSRSACAGSVGLAVAVLRHRL